MPDLDAYLARIGYSGDVRPSAETLRAIHRAHLLAIPYENLDIHRGVTLSLDPDAIYDKLVTGRRGGWCYEMNGLLAWALREMGFDVTLLASDVRREFVGDGAGGEHLVLMVRADGRPYLADTGFGNGILEPLPLEPGEYAQGYLTYGLLNEGERWFFRNQQYGGPGFVFTLTPRELPYFAATCHMLQTSPDSGFVRATVCHRFTPDWRLLTLRGAVLTTITEAGKREQVVDNFALYEQLLDRDFGLRLPDAGALWDKVWARHQAWTAENA
jgi:N-hydroxyarylamine O-acetyltransferase